MTTRLKRTALLLTASTSAFISGAGVATLAQSIPTSGVPTAAPEVAAEYAAKGLPMGAFRLFPTLGLSAGYDDNIYRTQSARKSDTIFEIAPRVALQSNWAEHYLVLRGGATDYEYSRYSRESRLDWDVDGEGRLDIVRGAALFGGVTYRHTYEPRESPDQLGLARSPTPYNVLHADGRFEYQPNRFGVITGVNFDKYYYERTDLIPSGSFSNRDRNFDEVEGFGRVFYEFSPGYSAYVHGAYNVRNFDLNVDRNGVNRDSTGWRLNAGMQMEVTRLITGEAYVGYIEQDYKKPLVRDHGFNFGADLVWTPTPLWTVRIGASHLMNETVVAQGGLIATDSNEERGTIGLDYSFRPNIVFHGDVTYLHDTFVGTTRVDNLTQASFGGTYLINSYMSANLSYIYLERQSSVFGQDFTDDMVRFTLGFQL